MSEISDKTIFSELYIIRFTIGNQHESLVQIK